MRRLPWIRIGLSLVMGVVLTLGMAWVVPNLGPFKARTQRYSFKTDQDQYIYFSILTWPGGRQIGLTTYDPDSLPAGVDGGEIIGSDDPRIPTWYDESKQSSGNWWASAVGSQGFPFRCMLYRYDSFTDANGMPSTTERGLWVTGQPSVNGWTLGRSVWTMPYLVDLGPFVINSVFYAVPSYVVLLMIARVWKARRHRSGCCVACGYDLAGITDRPCPECGRESGQRSL